METDKKSSANILKAYLRYLKLERNYSPNTLDAYRHDIAWLIDYCKREERDLLRLQLEDLQHFAASLHEFHIGPRSPQENKTSIIVRLRWPSGLLRSMLSSNRSTSSVDSTSGKCWPKTGDSSNSVGSLSI